MVDLLHGVVLAYRQAQGAVGDLMRQAEREQDMARVERAGGAGAAGGSADAVGVEHEQQRLALDALKAHVDRAGDMMLKAAVYLAVRDLAELGKELIAHRAHLRGVLLHIIAGLLECRRHCGDAGDVLCAGALAALLSAALDEVEDGDVLPHVQCADALGRMELVPGDGEHVYIHLLDVYRHMPRGLNSIAVERDAALTAERADLFHGLHGAYLVICEHDGDKAGILADSRGKLIKADDTVLMHIEQRDLKAFLFEPGKAVQHGMMLKPGGDQVLLALACAEAGGGEDGLIIGLAAAGGKDYLARAFRAEAVGHGLSGLGDILRHLLGEGVKARGVAVVLGQVRHHRVKRGLADAGGCSVIGVYEHVFLSFRFTFYLFSIYLR